jgi:hypothetical protein
MYRSALPVLEVGGHLPVRYDSQSRVPDRFEVIVRAKQGEVDFSIEPQQLFDPSAWNTSEIWMNDFEWDQLLGGRRVVQAPIPTTQLPVEFWDAMADADQWLYLYHGLASSQAKVAYGLIPEEPGASFEWPGLLNLWPATAEPTTAGVTEIADRIATSDPDLAGFLRKNADVSPIPTSVRPEAAGQEMPMPAAAAPIVPAADARGSEYDDRIYITLPAEWSIDAAAQAVQQAAGNADAALPGRDQIRNRFQRHLDLRTPGFEVRRDIRRHGRPRFLTHDEIITDDNRVYWVTYKTDDYLSGVGTEAVRTQIGTLHEQGWVRLNSGSRTTMAAIRKWSRAFRGATADEIEATLDAVLSPFHVDPSASQYGIFIGGTNQHFFGIGNVERQYNVYEGTKFYYGGVNNRVDFEESDDTVTLPGAVGLGWTMIQERILHDLKTFYRPGQKLHLFGWSRGGAMANDLARRLQDLGMRVDFVGMYDPVYSNGRPGQKSRLIDTTLEGYFGNFVTAKMTPNVKAAAALYAANEDRSFFPATRFTTQAVTRLITMKSPGGHGEVGGHFASNLKVQHLNLKAMIEFARAYGRATHRFRGIEEDVARIMSSWMTEEIALVGVEVRNNSLRLFHSSNLFSQWSPVSTTQYEQQLHSTVEKDWAPGGFGVQASNGLAFLAWLGSQFLEGLNPFESPLDGFGLPIGSELPPIDHYPRNLYWVDREVWDLPLRIGGRAMAVSEAAKAFIRSLYSRTINPNDGGWRLEKPEGT